MKVKKLFGCLFVLILFFLTSVSSASAATDGRVKSFDYCEIEVGRYDYFDELKPFPYECESELTFEAAKALRYDITISKYDPTGEVIYKNTVDDKGGYITNSIKFPANFFKKNTRYKVEIVASNEINMISWYGIFCTAKAGEVTSNDYIFNLNSYEDYEIIEGESPRQYLFEVYGNGKKINKIILEYHGNTSGVLLDFNPDTNIYKAQKVNDSLEPDFILPVGIYDIELSASVEGGELTPLQKTKLIVQPTELYKPDAFEVYGVSDGAVYGLDANIEPEWFTGYDKYLTLYNETTGKYVVRDEYIVGKNYYKFIASDLGVGKYKLTIYETNEYGEYSVDISFSITSEKVEYFPCLVRLAELDDVYETRDRVYLGGSVDSNGGHLETVYATYTDENGIPHIIASRKFEESKGAVSCSLSSFVNFVCGNEVITEPGVYTIDVYAKNYNSKAIKLYSKEITIVKEDTVPGNFNIITPSAESESYIGQDVEISWTESEFTGYYIIRIKKAFSSEVEYIDDVGNALSYTIPAEKLSQTGRYDISVIACDPEDNDKLNKDIIVRRSYSTDGALDVALNSIGITFADGENESEVMSDFTAGMYIDGIPECDITWSSSNTNYVNFARREGYWLGSVKRPDYDQTVKLTATITYKDQKAKYEKMITVKGYYSNDAAINKDLELVNVGYNGSDNANSVTENIIVTKVGAVNKSQISWKSSNSDIIAFNGRYNEFGVIGDVTRPAKDTEVTLTAVLTLGAVSKSREFKVVVKAIEDSSTGGNTGNIPSIEGGDMDTPGIPVNPSEPTVTWGKESYTVTQDGTFSLSGTVTADKKITKITAWIYNKYGYEQQISITPNTTSASLSEITFNLNTPELTGLPVGTYNIAVYAITEGNTKGVEVKGNTAYVTVNAKEEVVPTVTWGKESYTVTKDGTFSLSGTVTADKKITKITAWIYNKYGYEQQISITPNATSASLSEISFNLNSVELAGLPAGTYNIAVYAITEGNTKGVEVKGNTAYVTVKEVPAPVGNGILVPTELTIGDSFKITGTVGSNGGELRRVYVHTFYIPDDSYNYVNADVTSFASKTTYDLSQIGTITVGNQFFKKAGTYTFRVEAGNVNGAGVKLFETTITVKEKEITPTPTPVEVPSPVGIELAVPTEVTIGDSFKLVGTVSSNGGELRRVYVHTFYTSDDSYNFVNADITSFVSKTTYDLSQIGAITVGDQFFKKAGTYTFRVEAGNVDGAGVKLLEKTIIVKEKIITPSPIITDAPTITEAPVITDAPIVITPIPEINNIPSIQAPSQDVDLGGSGINIPVFIPPTLDFSGMIGGAGTTAGTEEEDPYRKMAREDVEAVIKLLKDNGLCSKPISENIVLPEFGSLHHARMSWSFQPTRIINTKGEVTLPENDTEVTIFIMGTCGEKYYKDSITVTVAGKKKTTEENKSTDKDDDNKKDSDKTEIVEKKLSLSFNGSKNELNITSNLTKKELSAVDHTRIAYYLKTTNANTNKETSTLKESSIEGGAVSVDKPNLTTGTYGVQVTYCDSKNNVIVSSTLRFTVNSSSVVAEVDDSKVGVLSISKSDVDGQAIISISNSLSANKKKKVSYTWINYYDKDNNNSLAYSKKIDGLVDTHIPVLAKGTYGVEVVYYNSAGNVIASGQAKITITKKEKASDKKVAAVTPKDLKVTSKVNNGVVTLKIANTLTDEELKSIVTTRINLYNKADNTTYRIADEKGMIESRTASVPAGTYGVEVVYYKKTGNDEIAVASSNSTLVTVDLVILNDGFVSEFIKGTPATVKGTVTSTAGLKSITASINGSKLDEVTITCNGKKSYSLADKDLDGRLLFDKLDAGEYTLVITAKDVNGTKIQKSYLFKVRNEKKPYINNDQMDFVIKKGEISSLSGKLISETYIKKVNAHLIYDGKKVLEMPFVPEEKIKSFDLSNIEIDTSNLDSGTYTLKIYVKTEASPNSAYVVMNKQLSIVSDKIEKLDVLETFVVPEWSIDIDSFKYILEKDGPHFYASDYSNNYHSFCDAVSDVFYPINSRKNLTKKILYDLLNEYLEYIRYQTEVEMMIKEYNDVIKVYNKLVEDVPIDKIVDS